MLTLDELNLAIHAALAQDIVRASETVELDAACGRVLAEDVVSSIVLPVANVSAMDGYALSDKTAQAGDVFTVVGEAIAGRPFSGTLQAGECVRIMTGAVVPDSAFAVEMQENVTREGEQITLQKDVKAGKNIRFRGEELSEGETVLQAGKLLAAADILLLAALGKAQVAVKRKLRVALLSTGDELVEPGQALREAGQLYDSNRALLKTLLRTLPVEVVDMGILADDLPLLKDALQTAAAQCDVIMTSGGVSVGDYDFLKQAVTELGAIHSYKVKMKPGKPFVFGHVGQAVYFGLPGNPVSGFVGFAQIVRPALWQLAGANPVPPALVLSATLSAPVRKSAGRRDFQRGVLQQSAQGWQVAPQGAQDSHRVYGLARANCLLDLPAEAGDLPAGSIVDVWPFLQTWRGGD